MLYIHVCTWEQLDRCAQHFAIRQYWLQYIIPPVLDRSKFELICQLLTASEGEQNQKGWSLLLQECRVSRWKSTELCLMTMVVCLVGRVRGSLTMEHGTTQQLSACGILQAVYKGGRELLKGSVGFCVRYSLRVQQYIQYCRLNCSWKTQVTEEYCLLQITEYVCKERKIMQFCHGLISEEMKQKRFKWDFIGLVGFLQSGSDKNIKGCVTVLYDISYS